MPVNCAYRPNSETVITPPDLVAAEAVLQRIDQLEVGQTCQFEPAIPAAVIEYLFMLLKSRAAEIDKGWRCSRELVESSWWRRLVMLNVTNNVVAIQRVR